MATPRLSVRANQSHRHVVVGKKCCFRMFFDKLAFPSLLAQGSLSREAPREQRRSWSKSSLLSPRVHLIFSSSTFKLTSLRPTSSLALGSSLSARKLQSNHWNEKIVRMQCMKEKCSLRIALTINDLLLCLVDLLAHLSEDLLFHHLAMIILLDHKLHKGLNTKWKSEH